MQRWDDLTPEEQQRFLIAEELRTQLATATAERDDYRARFRDLEHELAAGARAGCGPTTTPGGGRSRAGPGE